MTGLDSRLRQPTGKAPWPVILLAGEEASGKTYAALALSASAKVGPTYAFDLGEGSLDEYAPLGPFQIVEHDGTYRDFVDALLEVLALPVDPQSPTVVVIDGISLLWVALSNEADQAARRSKLGRATLQRDPDAEVVITSDKWNTATKRWYRVIDALRTWPGIVVLTARAGDVTVMKNGEPTKEKHWKPQGQKGLAYDVNMVVRMTSNPRTADLVKVRSLTVQIPDGGSLPLPDFTLDDLLFTKMGLSGDNTEVRAVVGLKGDGLDPEWVEQWKAKVATAEDTDALTSLWREAADQANAGRIGDEDMGELQAFLRAAHEQLTKSPDDKGDDQAAVEAGAA